MKNSILVFILILFTQSANAQVYQSYLQLDGQQYNPIITDFERLPNNNMAYSLILNDSAKAQPSNTYFYNETVAKNPGSGIIVMTPTNTVAWSYSWMPVNYLNDFIYIYALTTDNMGIIYLSGRYRGLVDMDPTNGVLMFQQPNANDVEGFLIKLNAAGNFIWAKKFGNTNISGMYCDLYQAMIHPNGNLVFGGSFRKSVDFDPNAGSQIVNANSDHNNSFILTLDTAGNFVDVHTLQVDSSAGLGQLSMDSLGNYYAIYSWYGTVDVDFGAGVTNYTSQNGYYNSCIAKYDANFNLLWSDYLGNDNMYSLKIRLKDNQTFYLYSSFADTIQLHNNTTAMANGNTDFFVERWDSAGNCLWAKTMSGTGNDNIYDIVCDNNKLYYLFAYDDSVHTNTGANDTTLYAANRDIALSVMTENGIHISSAEIKSDSAVYAEWSAMRMYNNEIYFSFAAKGITDLNPGAAAQNVSPTWTSPFSSIVVKWMMAPTSVSENIATNSKEILIWPNPSHNHFNIQTPGEGDIQIYNYSGILTHKLNAIATASTVSFDHYAQGIYYLIFTPTDKSDAVLSAKLIYQK